MSERCVFCPNEIGNNEARFVSVRATSAHPSCLIAGYPDAEGLQWLFAQRPRNAPQEAQTPTSSGTVQIAIIKYEDGVLAYAAITHDALYEKIYSYVVACWSDFYGDDTMPEDHMEAVAAYFENNSDECLSFDFSDI